MRAGPKKVLPGNLVNADPRTPRPKFEVWGKEMIGKAVALSGGSGRIYLPAEWIGKRVKIIRVD